jgi:predicted PurR-regulated permease PerM
MGVAARLNGPITTPAEPEGRLRPVALGLLIILLLALCGFLAIPFLPALTWAVAFAVIAWPLHAALMRKVHRKSLAAAATTFVVVVAIVVPGCFVAFQIAQEAGTASESLAETSADAKVRETLDQTPALAPVRTWMDRFGVNIDREVKQAVAARTGDAAGLLQGSVNTVLQFAICLFVLFHLLRDRESLLAAVRRLLPMTHDESARVFRGAADSVHANLYASLATSAISGAGGGLMFWLLGLPSPVLWGVVMFIIGILPIVGTFLVWLPAAAVLASNGQWTQALALVTWGVATSVLVDYLLYIRIAGNRMRLNQIAALIAFLGGLAVFGASGMVLGPAILAITVAVLDVWHYRSARIELPPTHVSD